MLVDKRRDSHVAAGRPACSQLWPVWKGSKPAHQVVVIFALSFRRLRGGILGASFPDRLCGLLSLDDLPALAHPPAVWHVRSGVLEPSTKM